MSQGNSQLADIARKLDQLIVLLKLSNRASLEDYRRRLERDKVYVRILDVSDGSMSYSDMSKKLSEELGVADITVKKKIADLKEMGLLITSRKGREVFYVNSGLLD
jgi:DNA-binding transcriptional ArsR family regulator